MEVVTARQSLSDFQFKLGMIPLQPQAPEQPSQLSLFYATSLEIYQVAKWCRASPKNTLSDLPIVNDPRDLTLKDDGMALCLYDDTMKLWSTVRDWVPQWNEVGQRIADAIEKNPAIQSSWQEDINHLTMGPGSLQNFREDLWVSENGAVRPVSSPFMLINSLDEEVKRLEAAYITYDEDEEEPQFPYSPLSNASDTASTPPLSPCTPCTPFLSPGTTDSPYRLPGSSELGTPSLLALPPSLSGRRTVSPNEIFSPLPQVEEPSDADVEPEAPPAPAASTQPLPELLDPCSDVTLPPSPNPPPSRSPSPPLAGPSGRPALKRSRWSEDESGDESDEFIPERRKAARPGKRRKVGSLEGASAKLKGKGTKAKCKFCGEPSGRSTDLPRHQMICKENPKRAARKDNCEICGKLLPVRRDAIKRHWESKSCLAQRQNGDDEDPHPLEFE